jgi:hypothetical protein
MIEPLRPMSTGQLLDRTFALYRKNFILFVGIAALGPAASLVFQLLMVGSMGVPGAVPVHPEAALASMSMGLIVGFLVVFAGMAISQAATVRAVAAVHLGRAITIAGAYKALRGRLWRVLFIFVSVMVLVGLGAGVIMTIAIIVGSLALVGGAHAGTGGAILGGLVAVAAAVVGAVLAIAIYIRYSLAIQACVVEDLRVFASLKRSAVLCKGAQGRVLAVILVFGVLGFIIAIALWGLAAGLAAVVHTPFVALILSDLASFVSGSLTGPLATIGLSLLYYDERVRKEAFDLQLMMASLDALAPPLATPAQI